MGPRLHRRLVTMVAVALLLGGACRPRGPEASQPTAQAPDDAAADTLAGELKLLEDPATRAQGLSALEQRVGELNEDAERAAVAKAITPALVEVWDEAAPQRSRMLRLCLLLAHPSTAEVWDRALGLDGTAAAYEHTLLALEGIAQTRAVASVPAVVAALQALLDDPRLDQGEHAGEIRAAMVETLGKVGDRRALPVLQAVLEQPVEAQPVGVHRKAAEALGRIADPTATDALLTVMYRVPDAPTTTNIAERSKIALAAIGAPAVPRLVAMLEGRHEAVRELAEQHGVTASNTALFAASILGAIGSTAAVEPLVRAFPQSSCRGRRVPVVDDPDDFDPIDDEMMRAVVANALGLLGDERAVEPLCQCATVSKNPGDMFSIAEALGRIGGLRATQCLARVIETGRYDLEAVQNEDFVHEIRWEAARFGLLAASPKGSGPIEAAIAKATAKSPMVARNMEAWAPGREVLERCGGTPSCLQAVLVDPNAHWFAREVAAVGLARLSRGNAEVAEQIARAYEVRNPDARVTMAWLAAHVMQDQRCGRCAEQLADILEQERGSRPPKEYQLSVLVARYSIGKLREPTSSLPPPGDAR